MNDEDAAASGRGFLVPQAEEPLVAALDDFHRHVGNAAWARAFAVLEQLDASEADTLVPGDDGLYLPASERVVTVVQSLPAEGREAFNLFFRPRAEQLAQQMEAARGSGDVESELALARQLFDRYPITDAGARAANQLGDAAYAAGRFDEAERYWQTLQAVHGEQTPPSPAQVYAKRSMAAARGGHTARLMSLRETIVDRHPAASIIVAGQTVSAEAFIDALVDEAPPVPAPATIEVPRGGPSDGSAPIWRMQLVSPTFQQARDEAARQWWGAMAGLNRLTPAVAADDQRLYANWLGVRFAVDLDTGKLLWRTDPFSALVENFDHFRHSDRQVERYAIQLVGESLLSVTIPLDEGNRWLRAYHLVAQDAATGTQRWTTARGPLNKISFLGPPVAADDAVLAIGHETGAADLTLYALSLADGQQRWSLPLGTLAVADENHHMQSLPQPVMHVDGQQLYVMTNYGALLAVDLVEQRIQWAYRYDPPVVLDPNGHWRGRRQVATTPAHGTLLHVDGVLYLKEAYSRRLFAIDTGDRRVIWQRPISADSSLVALDADALYLLGDELVAIDRATQALRWSTPLPNGAGSPRVVVAEDRLIVYTSRGIYEVSTKNGDPLRIFREEHLPNTGGWLDVMGGRYVSVSPDAIVAYPLPEADDGP